jgi:predicted RNA methylase
VRDWVAWHDGYDDPASSLSTRLTLVRSHLADALTRAPAGPIRVLSLCAGQGHDVLGVLPGHARRDDVTAVLVEADPINAAVARQRADDAGLAGAVEVRVADAGLIAAFADAVPADVLLLCGIFGNVSDADIRRTATAAAAMCAPGGTVIWTRNRREPDLTPAVRSWFADAGFDEIAFEAAATETLTGVGVHRLRAVSPTGPRSPGRPMHPAVLPDERLFTFRDA